MKIFLRIIVSLVLFPSYVFCSLSYNPFDLGIPPKEDLTHEDFMEVQQILNSKHDELERLIRSLYPNHIGSDVKPEDFVGRCLRGVKQTLIDPEKGWFPEVKLEKIGVGGDCCIVTSAPFLNKYPALARSKIEQLQKAGFNGYYLYFIGGYPNPTGAEIQYVGVPYAMKIFAMLEAQKRGFQKVLWVDSAVLPLRDPAPVFKWLEKNGAFIHGWGVPGHFWTYLIPGTRELLKSLTGTDILNTFYVNSVVFGLKMDTPLARSFIESYYKMVQLGTPFLSCFPEECVFMAIYGQRKFQQGWKQNPLKNLIKYQEPPIEDSLERIQEAQSKGFFFYQQRH